MNIEENTYCHPGNPNIRFRGIGNPPPWAVDVQPYVAPPPHPSDKYTSTLPPGDVMNFRDLWDFMVSRGVDEKQIVKLLDLHREDVKYNL